MPSLGAVGSPGGSPCFAAGTQVVTGLDENGQAVTRNIEDVQVGDWVLACDESDPDDSVELRQVTAVHVQTVDHLRLLTIAEADGTTEVLKTTNEHPFWVEGQGWVKAADLQPGQQFLTVDGLQATLRSSTLEAHPEGITVYNLTVDADHTYFVSSAAGDGAVWVHNLAPRPQAPPAVATQSPPHASSGGASYQGQAAFWFAVGMYADAELYTNWDSYRNLADSFRHWQEDLLDDAEWYWSGKEAGTTEYFNGQARLADMQRAFVERKIAEEMARRAAAQPQPAAGGVGQKPPTVPSAPAPGKDDVPNGHHRFPKGAGLREWFAAPPRNINVDQYLRELPESTHIGTPDALHRVTVNGERYLDAWLDFRKFNENATFEECVRKLMELEREFGLSPMPLH